MKSLEDLKILRDQSKKRLELREKGNDYRVVVGMGTCGIAAGARDVVKAFMKEIADHYVSASVTQMGCVGMCSYEPIVDVYDQDGKKTTYVHMNPEKVSEVVKRHIGQGEVCEEFVLGADR